ncbi:telomere-protecting terminal protein Tpg [Streptomyces sp. NRRL F-5193]|uniref:telomere-protecting terminal protein Tpg n=1 Tax=Streptomyces sp. NRRL F-5193 TaxID=1463860 RepID=UPI0006893242|nr:helix-turn-helix domain-containing protein [Streptomyces sp. NRRL F-5193]
MPATPVLDALREIHRLERDRLASTPHKDMPKSPQAQVAFLHRRLGRNTSRVAELLGVHPQTVRRYLRGQRRNPPPAFADRLRTEVAARFRSRFARQADTAIRQQGLRAYITATFTFSSPSAGTSDDGRERRLNEDLTPAETERLLAARDAGDEQRALQIVGQGVGEAYFGLRGTGMDVEVRDLIHIKFEL